jgi:hypothetical protein
MADSGKGLALARLRSALLEEAATCVDPLAWPPMFVGGTISVENDAFEGTADPDERRGLSLF